MRVGTALEGKIRSRIDDPMLCEEQMDFAEQEGICTDVTAKSVC